MTVKYLIFVDKVQIDVTTLNDVDKQTKGKKAEHLYLIMESGGGDAYSAARIMHILHKRFPKISAIIPNKAMSAATLMALGTDEIFMSERSMLGPLDLPIEHHKDGSRISALDVANTLTNIATLSDYIARDRYKFLRGEIYGKKGDNEVKTGKLEAAKLALETATELVKPIISQIDPYHLQKSYRELKIGQTYAKDLLLARMMKDDERQAEETADKLVNDYPAHEYFISSTEAKVKLGLNIQNLEKLDFWNKLNDEYQKLVKQKPYLIVYNELEVQESKPLIEQQNATSGS
jgi:hypothetical protein